MARKNKTNSASAVQQTARGRKKSPTVKSTKTSVQKLAVEQKTLSQMPSVHIQRKYVIVAAIIILLGVLLYSFRALFVAAVVNGQPISRWEVMSQAEKQAGKQTLDTLVTNALVEQEAQKKHVTVSDSEIDSQIKTIQSSLSKNGQTLDQVLVSKGMTRDDLRKLIRLDKLVEKMAAKDVKVSDKEVQDYIDKNKDSLPQNQTDSQLQTTVRQQLQQQKANDKVQAWLANLQKNAHVTYFVQY